MITNRMSQPISAGTVLGSQVEGVDDGRTPAEVLHPPRWCLLLLNSSMNSRLVLRMYRGNSRHSVRNVGCRTQQAGGDVRLPEFGPSSFEKDFQGEGEQGYAPKTFGCVLSSRRATETLFSGWICAAATWADDFLNAESRSEQSRRSPVYPVVLRRSTATDRRACRIVIEQPSLGTPGEHEKAAGTPLSRI